MAQSATIRHVGPTRPSEQQRKRRIAAFKTLRRSARKRDGFTLCAIDRGSSGDRSYSDSYYTSDNGDSLDVIVATRKPLNLAKMSELYVCNDEHDDEQGLIMTAPLAIGTLTRNLQEPKLCTTNSGVPVVHVNKSEMWAKPHFDRFFANNRPGGVIYEKEEASSFVKFIGTPIPGIGSATILTANSVEQAAVLCLGVHSVAIGYDDDEGVVRFFFQNNKNSTVNFMLCMQRQISMQKGKVNRVTCKSPKCTIIAPSVDLALICGSDWDSIISCSQSVWWFTEKNLGRECFSQRAKRTCSLKPSLAQSMRKIWRLWSDVALSNFIENRTFDLGRDTGVSRGALVSVSKFRVRLSEERLKMLKRLDHDDEEIMTSRSSDIVCRDGVFDVNLVCNVTCDDQYVFQSDKTTSFEIYDRVGWVMQCVRSRVKDGKSVVVLSTYSSNASQLVKAELGDLNYSLVSGSSVTYRNGAFTDLLQHQDENHVNKTKVLVINTAVVGKDGDAPPVGMWPMFDVVVSSEPMSTFERYFWLARFPDVTEFFVPELKL